ncbi:MAG: shikimate kinase [Verrucomicrobiota bacterium]
MHSEDSRPPGQHVVLIGFMGSGKTTVGALLARQLGLPFLDMDHLIVQQAGHSIPRIFEEEGEEGFRRRESAVLAELAAAPRSVISTGGGVVTVADNVPKLRALGFVIWLNPPEDVLFSRICRNQERPLLRTPNPRQTVNELLTLRLPLYASAAILEADVSEVTPEEAAYGLAESARVYFASESG